MHSSTMALIGTAFIWVFFPAFVMDPPVLSSKISSTALYTAPLSMLYGLAASTLMSISTPYVLNEKLMIRDVILGPIAGGISVASAGFHITNPAYAILIGTVAGIIQPVINFFEHKHSLERPIINTISFGLFGINGLIGSVWASIWSAAVLNTTDGMNYNFDYLAHPGK